MQAAGHLVACTGFIPVALRAPDAPLLPTPTDPSERFADSLLGENVSVSDPEYAKPENQLKRARQLARMRVSCITGRACSRTLSNCEESSTFRYHGSCWEVKLCLPQNGRLKR